MTVLEELEDEIIDNGIDIINTQTRSIIASAIRCDDDFCIMCDKTKINTKAEEYVVLAHEYSHIQTGSLYGFTTSIRSRQRREYKANKYMVQKILPVEKLKKALKAGFERWEIAEDLNITEDVIDKAIRIYRNMELI